VYHISHPLLKREDEALWEIVRSLSQLQLRGPSDVSTLRARYGYGTQWARLKLERVWVAALFS
jgi:hypothetical protein